MDEIGKQTGEVAGFIVKGNKGSEKGQGSAVG